MSHVSVIIPTYNRAKLVTGAIDSVLAQTYADYEIIVVDDGSSDNTQDMLKPYRDKIHYIYQENAGVSAARNAGIRLARGEWIACLDSDDVWLPDKLKRQMEIVEQSPVELGCVICNVQLDPPSFSDDCSFKRAPFFPDTDQGICLNMSSILLTRFIMFNQCALIRKQCLDQIGGYDEQLKYLEDYDLALKLSFICTWGYDTSLLVQYKHDSLDSLSAQVNSRDETVIVFQIYKNLQTFLKANNIAVPRLLENRVRLFKLQIRNQHLKVACFILKLNAFFARRMPWYPRPKIQKLN